MFLSFQSSLFSFLSAHRKLNLAGHTYATLHTKLTTRPSDYFFGDISATITHSTRIPSKADVSLISSRRLDSRPPRSLPDIWVSDTSRTEVPAFTEWGNNSLYYFSG